MTTQSLSCTGDARYWKPTADRRRVSDIIQWAQASSGFYVRSVDIQEMA